MGWSAPAVAQFPVPLVTSLKWPVTSPCWDVYLPVGCWSLLDGLLWPTPTCVWCASMKTNHRHCGYPSIQETGSWIHDSYPCIDTGSKTSTIAFCSLADVCSWEVSKSDLWCNPCLLGGYHRFRTPGRNYNQLLINCLVWWRTNPIRQKNQPSRYWPHSRGLICSIRGVSCSWGCSNGAVHIPHLWFFFPSKCCMDLSGLTGCGPHTDGETHGSHGLAESIAAVSNNYTI